ncbi:hypothetical protein C8R44DRAFT_750810 [Mycena epipterygia]|nr:hypothetical protein C8R44DRAFT_750810 [Mycena epipterygia]
MESTEKKTKEREEESIKKSKQDAKRRNANPQRKGREQEINAERNDGLGARAGPENPRRGATGKYREARTSRAGNRSVTPVPGGRTEHGHTLRVEAAREWDVIVLLEPLQQQQRADDARQVQREEVSGLWTARTRRVGTRAAQLDRTQAERRSSSRARVECDAGGCTKSTVDSRRDGRKDEKGLRSKKIDLIVHLLSAEYENDDSNDYVSCLSRQLWKTLQLHKPLLRLYDSFSIA